jgi:geranylgeranyl diphosphate synthase type II
MLIKAYEHLTQLEPENQVRILPLFNTCAMEVCEGQQYDMDFEQKEEVSEADYLEMIRLKTAVLLGYSMEAGAIVGGADTRTAALLKEFAISVGVGFQLKDDLLDVYADKDKFGKQTGGDILANKKTFLLIKALENADNGTLAELQKWLNAKEYVKEEKVKAVTDIYNQLDIKNITEAKINSYFNKAFELLDLLDIPAAKKEVIHSFAKNLINREK